MTSWSEYETVYSPQADLHGTHSSYVNRKCKCASCREANAAWQWQARRNRRRAMLAGAVNPPHGKTSTYVNYMCRCVPCTRAHSETCARAHARRKLRQEAEKK